ncbi:MAG: FG-GAP-like repeat-containing protein [Gemmataceae bacterium]
MMLDLARLLDWKNAITRWLRGTAHRPRRKPRPCRGRPALALEELEDRTVPTLLGQQLFPADYPWNQNISNAPVASNSAAVITHIGASIGIHPDWGTDSASNGASPIYGIPYNVVNGNSVAKVHVVIDNYPGESDLVNIPIPAGAVIEGDYQNGPNPNGGGYNTGQRGDSHLIVWDADNNIAYELFGVTRPSDPKLFPDTNGFEANHTDGAWHAAQESVWNMNTNSFRTLGDTSADAAGLSILAGLARPDEGLPSNQGGQGAINHALRFTLPSGDVNPQYIYPASHVVSASSSSTKLPFGARLRLKNTSAVNALINSMGPEAQIIAHAMQQYGLVLADIGSAMYVTGTSAAQNANNQISLTWDMNDVLGLHALTAANFDVIDLTPTVTGLSASSGSAGSTITITGQNFSGAAGHLSVLFGNSAATSVNVVDDAHITAIVPNGSGQVHVRVQSGVNATDPNNPSDNVKAPIFGYGISATSSADLFTLVPKAKADGDGDGKDDFAIWRPVPAAWYVLKSSTSNSSKLSIPLGGDGDVPVRADFDGDGKADLAVFEPDNGKWTIATSSSNFSSIMVRFFGQFNDIPLAADFDNDGKADLVVFRPGTGQWIIGQSSANYSTRTFQFGQAGDVPLLGDFDGDGKPDIVVWRPGSGNWIIDKSSANYTANVTYQWGQAGDVPLTGDVDGDGTTDLTVWRPGSGQFLVRQSSGGNLTVAFGQQGDTPLLNDYDADGKADLGVFRPGTGNFYVLTSSTSYSAGSALTQALGTPADVPLAADFDGDGKNDIAVFRPVTGGWLINQSSTGFRSNVGLYWGQNGDIPLIADFDSDGKADLTIYRPGTGQWLAAKSASNYSFASSFSVQFGQSGDVPLIGNFDGDGKPDLVLWRASAAQWLIEKSSNNYASVQTITWGAAGDIPRLADVDGDGKSDLIAFRPGTGQWFIDKSGANFTTNQTVNLGTAGDIPVVGRFDGDAKADLAVWRPSAGQWIVAQSTTNYTTTFTKQFGQDGDIPLNGDWDGDGKAELTVYRPRSGMWFIDRSSTNFADFLQFQWGQDVDLAR